MQRFASGRINVLACFKIKSEMVFILIKETSLSLPKPWKTPIKKILLSQFCPSQLAEGYSSPCSETSGARDLDPVHALPSALPKDTSAE